ncbi:MAG: hypothetical protein GX844_06030 [Alcaligenaceae bacterium]|jgi:hypothetical protein|nr:hypothetical protein [Alcaligenaceae bacterium]
MENGFYSTLVEGSTAHLGTTIIEDNRIRGGDAEFLYSGTISVETSDNIVANIRFRSYKTTGHDSFFDFTERDFELSLSGQKTENGFRVTGYSPSGREMVILGKRLSAIDFSD